MYQKVKELCKEKGISVGFLERELGFSNGSISKWNVSIPRLDSAIKVANYFKVPVSYFLDVTDQAEKEETPNGGKKGE